MRLIKYINEISKVSNEEVNKILDDGFKKFEKRSKLYKWWLFKYLKLIDSFKTYNIFFYIRDGFLSKLFIFDKNTRGSTTLTTDIPKIYIGLTKKQLKQLNTTNGINLIKNEIKSTLFHELTHVAQRKKISSNYLNYLRANIDKFNQKLKNITYDEYLSGKDEIDAFAREAVNNIENNDFDIILQYLKTDKKIQKRFFKKLYQYLDVYGSNKAKIKFKLKMSGALKDIDNKDLNYAMKYIDNKLNKKGM